MTEDTIVPTISNESDDLLTYEREEFPESYRDVVQYRRNRLRSNAAKFSGLWNCFMGLDEIWERDLDHVKTSIVTMKDFIPVSLFYAAHAKLHVVIDLAFSGYLVEAYSIARDAVEHVVHGCKLRSKPELVDVWVNWKNDEASMEAWKREFWFDKRVRLFANFPDLFEIWKACSDYGSHANRGSLFQLFCFDTLGEIDLRYNGVSPEETPMSLSLLLACFCNSEERIFDLYRNLLISDSRLQQMRRDLNNNVLSAVTALGLLD